MSDQPTITDTAVEAFHAAALAEAARTTTDEGIRSGLAAAAPHIAAQPTDALPCGHSLDRVENDEVTSDEHDRLCGPVALPGHSTEDGATR